jgi:hypothetical protein
MNILKKYKDNELLKRVLYLANSKRIKFYIKQIPEYTSQVNPVMELKLEAALSDLSGLYERRVTGHDAISVLKNILTLLSPDDAYVIERIIEKDCKIGMGTANINKIFTDLVEKTPYMGAKAYNIKLINKLFEENKKVFSELKADGRYCNAIIRSGDVELESRQGEPTIVTGAKFLGELKKFDDCVLNGELIMSGVSRYESNGIISSIISISKKKNDGEDVTKEIIKFENKHMGFQDALDAIKYVCWDTISVYEYFDKKSNKPYFDRLDMLEVLIYNAKASMISVIEWKLVSSVDEAMSHFQEALKRCEEGTIVKSYDGVWKDGKPTHQVKLKKEINLDLRIVGFNYGTGKNSKLISSVNVESSDGLLKTSPTGMNEDIMDMVTKNQDKLLNAILEIKCSGISHDSDDNYSVLHPVYKELRTDKNTANSLKECVEIDKASTFL